MRLPDNTLTPSKIGRYGGGALTLIPGYDVPGCPWAYHLRYEERRPRLETEPMLRGRAIHRALQLIEQSGVSLDAALSAAWPPDLGPVGYADALRHLQEFLALPDDGTHTISTEIEMRVPLFEWEGETVYAGGIIDRVAMRMQAPNDLIVDDFKTSRRPVAKSEVEGSYQLMHYAFLVSRGYDRFLPDARKQPRITARIVLTGHGYSAPKTYTPLELDAYGEWLTSVGKKILLDEEPEPHLNPGCTYCDFRLDCPVWTSLPLEAQTIIEKVVNRQGPELFPLRAEAQRMEAQMKSIKEDVDLIAKEYLRKTGEPTAEFDGGSVSMAEGWQESVEDLEAAHRLMGDEFYQRVTLSKKELERWAKDHPSESSRAFALLLSRFVGDRLSWNRRG